MKFKISALIFVCYSVVITKTAPVDVNTEEDPELIGGYFQGDMELEVTRNGVIEPTRHWPDHIVHYKIDDVFDVAHSMHIMRAMANIEEVSCIRFHYATSNITNYIHIIGEPSGCHSKVGYQGKLQTLNLQIDPLEVGCFRLGTIMHELLHSLGFHHQQSASNRDDFVRIVEENIKEGKENNFKKYSESDVTDFGIPYDYGSVLHYSSTAFSKNGQRTIIPLLGDNIEIGQRRVMSSADIDKLNIMYKCAIGV